MIEPKHIKAGALTIGAMILSFAANWRNFRDQFYIYALGGRVDFCFANLVAVRAGSLPERGWQSTAHFTGRNLGSV